MGKKRRAFFSFYQNKDSSAVLARDTGRMGTVSMT
jgi:hypothetical protein